MRRNHLLLDYKTLTGNISAFEKHTSNAIQGNTLLAPTFFRKARLPSSKVIFMNKKWN